MFSMIQTVVYSGHAIVLLQFTLTCTLLIDLLIAYHEKNMCQIDVKKNMWIWKHKKGKALENYIYSSFILLNAIDRFICILVHTTAFPQLKLNERSWVLVWYVTCVRRFRKKILCDSFIRKCLELNESVVCFRKYMRERERERMR